MKEICGVNVKVREGELLRREKVNHEYLTELKNNYLLRNFQLEAGRYSGRGMDANAMGGWEDPTCQLRGHFLGHFLSACAFRYDATKDPELKAKCENIIKELSLCQKDNGGEWVCSIPEKYFEWLKTGKSVWAPQYTVHKLFMGLVDVYKYMGLKEAVEIADKLADWFVRWSFSVSKEQFDDILDTETGGMLEVWADLYEITKDEKYIKLIERYYRGRLFDPLLEDKDVLTNMHANTTIPEVLGCARVYEVLGETKYLDIVKSYWKCAVTDRGWFITRGQTQGEIWTPKYKLKARLGDKNQEHCTVYNMIRLAEFLFRMTEDPMYMHYIEYNVQNGIFAQTYYQGIPLDKDQGGFGLLTYFLPMKAASRKDWAGKMDSFFCCHGTMVQANAAWNRRIFYSDAQELFVTMYWNCSCDTQIDNKNVHIDIAQDYMNGSLMSSSENNQRQTLTETASVFANKPSFRKYVITFKCDSKVHIGLNLRIPDWINAPAKVWVNDKQVKETTDTSAFVRIERDFRDGDKITLTFPIGLRFETLPDDDSVGGFLYGPDVLAGITPDERVLKLDGRKPEEELSADTERQWGDFRTFYKTENQDPGISFRKLNEVGYEPYQIYFKVK